MNQIYLPKLSPINKIIIIMSACFFVIDFILTKSQIAGLSSYLGLSAEGVLGGHIYRLVTYPFISHSLLEVILNSLMLWLMASEFEVNWGRARYLKFLTATVIGGGILFLIINFLFFNGSQVFSYPLVGLSGIVSSMCLAYAVIYPDRLFSFLMIIPVKAKYFCMLLVVISLFQGLSGPTGVGAWGQLGAILSAFLFMVVISNKKFSMLSQKWDKMAQGAGRGNKSKGRAKLSIVKDDDDNSPKYWQ